MRKAITPGKYVALRPNISIALRAALAIQSASINLIFSI
jgi:hypothetical protein